MEKLFCDLRTDGEKADFFLSGQGYSTGIIAKAVQNDVAMAYRRCAEYKKACHDAQAIRNAALEEAAKDAEAYPNPYSHDAVSAHACDMTAAAIGKSIRALKSQVSCQTCGGNGMIGGPSFYEPGEGGEPCPDCAQDLEEKPNLFNPLTPYGLLIRALRIVAGTSLMEMSEATGYTPAYLSSVEFGREKLTFAMISAVRRFFGDKGLDFPGELLWQAARAAKEQP